jgi:sulfur carrier protein
MRIIVNGSEREVPDGLTVAGVVARLSEAGADGRGVAVAVEATVVPRSEWGDRELVEGERVEVVGAIQGG